MLHVIFLVLTVLLLGITSVSQAQGVYKSHNYPWDGVLDVTVLTSMNEFHDVIAGSVFGFHGTKVVDRVNGETLLQCPGAHMTFGRSLNRHKTVAGECSIGAEVVAFLKIGTTYRLLRFPAATQTSAWGHNDSNTVVGTYRDTSGQQWGFFYRDPTKRYASFAVSRTLFPDATGTVLTGITQMEHLSGYYTTIDGRTRGFWFHNKVSLALDAPGALHTIPVDINESDQVVGVYADPVGLVRSFLYDKPSNQWYQVVSPDPTVRMVDVTGIAKDGTVVGRELRFDEVTQTWLNQGYEGRNLAWPLIVPPVELAFARAAVASTAPPVSGITVADICANPLLQPIKVAATLCPH
jgi:hypothetical protein